jgi:hypothetical protein
MQAIRIRSVAVGDFDTPVLLIRGLVAALGRWTFLAVADSGQLAIG